MFAQSASLTHWSVTAAGTNAGASATRAAPGAGKALFVTHISGHTDTDSLITLSVAGDAVFESNIDISVQGFSFSFPVGVIPVTANTAAVANVATSTTDCQINMSGFTI